MATFGDLVIDEAKEAHRPQSSRLAGATYDVVHLQHSPVHRQLVLSDARSGLERPLDWEPALAMPKGDHRIDVSRHQAHIKGPSRQSHPSW
jgi:hypothetical protein